MEGLIAHKDTKRVPFEIIEELQTPERTKTWGVIGHRALILTARAAIQENGYNITEEAFSLSKDGHKMFGTMTLLDPYQEDKDKHKMLGIRNSTNKSLSVGLTAGAKVVVCDNMLFQGDFLKFRKHTGNLDMAEISVIMRTAVEDLKPQLGELLDWHENLKNHGLTQQDKEALVVRAVDQEVLPAGRFSLFYKLFFKKENENNEAVYEDTLYGFHGALTQIWSKQSLIGSGPRHKKLNMFLDKAKDELTIEGRIKN